MVFALVGALGVGSQWLAWRLRMPAIVLMLVAGLIVGPGLGLFDPARDIGPLMGPMISVAVAIILFEGGLTLTLHSLRGEAEGLEAWAEANTDTVPLAGLCPGRDVRLLVAGAAPGAQEGWHLIAFEPPAD